MSIGRWATRRPRTWLRSRYGLWPLLELRNRVVHGPGTPWWWVVEGMEVARLRRRVGRLPQTMVTTVVPTFRRPELLVRAVSSALDQTVRDHLVIVVDDGGGMVSHLPRDERLVTVSLSRNSRRLGLVRNVGIRLSRSPYVAFLDDDNEWRPNHLAVALRSLESGGDMVYTAIERFRADGSLLDVVSRDFDRRDFADGYPYVDSNAIVVRRSPRVRFSRIRRPMNLFPKEDWELAWRLSRRLALRHVPERTVRYLVNEDSYYTPWRPHEI